jgi:hypothetical protein
MKRAKPAPRRRRRRIGIVVRHAVVFLDPADVDLILASMDRAGDNSMDRVGDYGDASRAAGIAAAIRLARRQCR